MVERAVERLLDEAYIVSGSEKTVKAYRYGVARFKRETGVSDMDRFVEDAKAGRVRAGDYLVRFIKQMKEKGLSSHTIRTWVSPVRLLLKNEGVQVRNHRLKTWSVTPVTLPSKAQLEKMVALASVRNRAILTMLLSSGMRGGELCRLKMRNLDLDERKITIEAAEAKERKGRRTFFSREAAKYLSDYLTVRRDRDDKLTKDSFVFVNDESGNQYGKYTGGPLTVSRVSKIVRRLGKAAGSEARGKDSRKRYSIHTHILRHYFITKAIVGGMDSALAHALAGHARYMDVYENYPDQDLRSKYDVAEPALTVTSIAADETAMEEIEGLRAEISRLESLIVKSVSFQVPGSMVTIEGGYNVREDDEPTRALLRRQGFKEQKLPGEPKYFHYTKPASSSSPQARNRKGR